MPGVDADVRWKSLQVRVVISGSLGPRGTKGCSTLRRPRVQDGERKALSLGNDSEARVIVFERRISQEENRQHSRYGEVNSGAFSEESTDRASPNGSPEDWWP